MALESSFQFGIELELLLGCRKKSYQSWSVMARDVSKRLLKAGILNHINEGNDKSPENYREWSVVQEVTIPSQPGKNIWGIELVSPVYSLNSAWGIELESIFTALSAGGFTSLPSPNCSTHIHLSGTPNPLSPAELAALARTALIYESALDSLVPAIRRGSSSPYWCQSNRANPAIRGLPLAGVVSVVEQAGGLGTSINSNRPIVEVMNLFPAASAYGRAHKKSKDFIRGKVYKWDFEGMMPNGRQTVEFRLPPGCTNTEEARGWVEVAVAFVAGAIGGGGHGTWVEDDEGASLEALWELLLSGATVLGWENIAGLQGVFLRRE